MTLSWWTDYWWWWLLFVLVSWLVMEIASLVYAHITGQKHLVDYTLSDTIRRWSSKYRWLALTVMIVTMFLLWHFFVERNPT